MCEHRLADGPLTCVRADPHDPAARGGHVYHSSTASEVDDRHTEGGHG